jgi:hypothetical protein
MPCVQRSPIATPADVSRRPTQEIERNELEKLQASAKALQLAAMSYNNGKREFLTEVLGRTNDIVTWSAHFTYRGVSVFAVVGSIQLSILQEYLNDCHNRDERKNARKDIVDHATYLIDEGMNVQEF